MSRAKKATVGERAVLWFSNGMSLDALRTVPGCKDKRDKARRIDSAIKRAVKKETARWTKRMKEIGRPWIK